MRTPGIVAEGVPIAWLMIALWAAGALIVLIDSMSSVELAASIRRNGGPFAIAVRAIIGAYGGWNTAVYFVEELTDPRRAVVRATFAGIVAVAAVYLLMNLAILHALTPGEMACSTLVAADAAARVFGSAPGAADRLVTIVSLIGGDARQCHGHAVPTRAVRDRARLPGAAALVRGRQRNAAGVASGEASLAALLATIGVYDLLLSFSLSLVTAMAIAVTSRRSSCGSANPGWSGRTGCHCFPRLP